MKALDTIQLCAREFNDIAYERIARDSLSAANPNQSNWLEWLNDAQRSVVLVRPDSLSATLSILLGTGTRQTLSAVTSAVGGTTAFRDAEVPVGVINGVNKVFTLVDAPVPAASLQLFLKSAGNDVLQKQGVDYTLVDDEITYVVAPVGGATHLAWYRTGPPVITGAAQALRILDVIRNMGANGTTPGKSIRLVDLAQKSSVNRDWHTEADVGVVREVIYDDKKDPLTFYVSPPAAGKYIELTVSKAPLLIAAADVLTADLEMNDIYAGPVQAWMLHRAYGVGTNSQVNLQKSWQYFSSFFNQLGVKIKSELFTAAAQPGQLPVADPAQKAAYP